jgi:hypothetical protein
MLERVRQILYRPVFGTQVVPADARVDPTQFPEEEFPVYCPKCEYLLRGLPDGRCPECGEPFERAELLVLEYARWRVMRQKRYNQTMAWLGAIALTVFVAAIALHTFFTWRVSGIASNGKAAGTLQPLIDQWVSVVNGLLFVHLTVLGVLVVAGAVATVRYRRRAAQRRRIVAGILPKADPR